MNTTLDQIATRIIKEQELIIGPIAWQEAGHVPELMLDDHTAVQISSSAPDPKMVIDQLVGRYERLFGRASREACKEAVASLLADLSPGEIPSTLAA
ncbi:MAG: hypothetical protein JWL75_614 [Parcubacteria group bacterium]|nr:hypothetical protein [Parcubacteria group bacterium]